VIPLIPRFDHVLRMRDLRVVVSLPELDRSKYLGCQRVPGSIAMDALL